MASQKTTLIFVLCVTCQTLIATSIGTTQAPDINGETNDRDKGHDSLSTKFSDFISSEIRSLIGKTLNFSHCSAFTDGVQLKLDGKPINLSAFTVDESNAKLLSKMLRGRNITELFYVASKLAKIEAREAALENKPVTSLSMEDIFDPANDIVVRSRDVDEMDREITPHPKLHDLDHTPDSVSSDRVKRKATYSFFYWPTVIPYKISSDFDNDPSYTQAIKDGVQHWVDETCLEFKQLANDNNYGDSHIVFRNWDGCYSSFVGRGFGNGQTISIGRNGGCGTKGVVAHEIGHALGFYHEQSRPDRDLYVKILTENVRAARWNNFAKREWRDAKTAGIPYDYSSIMHYGLNFFSSNRQNTISLLEEDMDRVVGSQDHLSFYDVKLANYIYCPDRCSEGLAWSACQNDGYRDPKNCSRCRCPDGWTGQYCTEVKPGVNAECGSTELLATTTWQTFKSPNYDAFGYTAYSECTWHIKAPLSNYRIVMRFVGQFVISPCTQPCWQYIEVRNKDMARTGPRFCCYSTPSKQIVSHGNQALLLMRTTVGYRDKGFQLEYIMEPCGCSTNDSVYSVPACLQTQSVQCDGTYVDCSSGICVNKFRNNTCYNETKKCCSGFELQGDFCYRTSIPSWTAWSVWTSCSKTCGEGSSSRTRTCNKQPCSGSSFETQTCNNKACPDSWSDWNAWTACTHTCGTGYQYRLRTCPGTSCRGEIFETRTCNNNSCVGEWANWNPWSGCSKTCGSGSRSRNRGCLTSSCSGLDTDTQACNTNPCSSQWSDWSVWTSCSTTCNFGSQRRTRTCPSSSCSGIASESKYCYMDTCPGQWSEWNGWSVCSKTCGSGSRTRDRYCFVPPCSGSKTESQDCNTNICPGTWNSWNAWSSCSKTCGSGSKTRNRVCLAPPCSDGTTESQTCNTNACPSQLSNWNAWSSCSKTCGSGTRTRSRTCTGVNCSGPTSEVEKCSNTECSPPGLWSNWSEWTGCSTTCGAGFKVRSRKCPTPPCSGHTYQGMACENKSCSDSWSAWAEWSSCTKTCGYGIKTRRRTCSGRTCSGLVAESQFCNTNACPQTSQCTYIGRCDELPGRVRYCIRYRAC